MNSDKQKICGALIQIRPLFQEHNLFIKMQKQIENEIYQILQRGNPCPINFFTEKYASMKAVDILEVFVNIFKSDKSLNYDLLCHIVVANNEQIFIQMERYSNIQKGILILSNSNSQMKEFRRDHIKELKIMAIFPKNLSNSDVESVIKMPLLHKTKEYKNNHVLVPKITVENPTLMRVKSKKQQIEPSKKQEPAIQQKKGIKKTHSKSSIQMDEKKTIAPLKKISSKDQPSSSSGVLTNYAAERSKLQEQVEKKPIQSKKLCLQSDEEYYAPANVTVFNQQLSSKLDQHQETDHSAVKVDQQNERMEVETQHNKKQISTFVVDDRDDQDESFARMIVQSKKAQLTHEVPPQPSIMPKKENPKIQPPSKPKVEAPKPNQSSKPQAAGGSLKNWLIAKKV